MSLPLFKLGALLVKQLSKPVAKLIKEKATSHEKVRTLIVMPIGQIYHKFDLNVRMRLMGLGKPDKVPVLTDAKAIEIGGDLLAEFIVFGTAITILLVEYWRSSVKSANKVISDEKKVEILQIEQARLITQVENTTRILAELEKSINLQKEKTEDLNKKYKKLTENKIKTSSKSNQTTVGRQVGKIIIPSKIQKTAEMDVKNSILYQSAEEAVNEIRFYGAKDDQDKKV